MLALKSISKNSLQTCHDSLCAIFSAKLHVTVPSCAWSKNTEPRKFLSYNEKMYPPQDQSEEKRPAFICHQKLNIKYSPKKMWYIAGFIRGMTVDEAVKQLSFVLKKGAYYAKQTLLEAQQLAVERHNVEFKSNLWVAESFATKGLVIKGIRRHARGRMGEIRYMHCHYFVRLEEGAPPADFFNRHSQTPQEQLDSWLEEMRKRKIIGSL